MLQKEMEAAADPKPVSNVVPFSPLDDKVIDFFGNKNVNDKSK